MRFAHVINVIPDILNEELAKIQAISMNSMSSAKAKLVNENTVDLLAVCFENENLKLVSDFKLIDKLKFSTSDYNLGFKKKLPFLKDILQLALAHSQADYIIYTNSDIIVVPEFYNVIVKYIAMGHDALVINRRRISGKFFENPDPVLMFAETGKSHIGYDCFVIKRSLFERFYLTNVCVGVPPACNDLFYNIFCYADNPVLFCEKQITYHIGMDLYKAWGEKKLEKLNYGEMNKMLKKIKPDILISKFPGSELNFFKRHYKWFWNPTFSYPLMFQKDLSQLFRKRKPKKKPEIQTGKQNFLEWIVRTTNFND